MNKERTRISDPIEYHYLSRSRNNRYNFIEKQDGDQKNGKKDIKMGQILFLLF